MSTVTLAAPQTTSTQDLTAGVHFRYPEVIGVRVPLCLDHAPDHDVAQILAQRDEIIHRRAARREQIAQLSRE